METVSGPSEEKVVLPRAGDAAIRQRGEEGGVP